VPQLKINVPLLNHAYRAVNRVRTEEDQLAIVLKWLRFASDFLW